MMRNRFHMFLSLALLSVSFTCAQTQKPLTNADIMNMTTQGFEASLLQEEIESSPTDFDVTPQALTELKSAGVSQNVMEAMISAHSKQPSAAVEAAHGSGASPATDASCQTNNGCLLRDGTEVPLSFAADLNSKTAHVGDPVEFLLAEDLKVGERIVVAKGTHAVATVATAKKAGMTGKPGDLSVQLQYLVLGGNHVRLRGTQGKEGESKTGATVALTVLFGPIGLIKHGKDVDIPAGTPLKAYIDQDVWLPALSK